MKWLIVFVIFAGLVVCLALAMKRRAEVAGSRDPMQLADDIFRDELHKRGMEYRAIAEGLYEVVVQGQTVTANLENIRRDFERDGDAGRIARFVDQISVTLDDTRTWDDLRPFVRYSLEPADYDHGFQGVLCKRLSDELVQVFVYTSTDGSQISWINESMLGDWGVIRDQVLEQAEKNMAAIIDDAQLEVSDIHGSPLGMISTNEIAFKASLVLSPSFRDLVFPTHGWPVCVVIPCRDFVYVMRVNDQKLLSRLGGVVLKEYRNSGYPITTDVLRVSDDGISAIGTYPDEQQVD